MRWSSISDIELRQGLPLSPPFIPSSAIHHVTDWAFQGEWWRGARQGWGRMVYTNGDYFEGEWEAGLRQGDGVLVYANGNVYEGQWEADKKEGKGRFSHASGVIQVSPSQQQPIFSLQDGFWVADCLKCSVVTHREPGQNKDDTDKFSYVDIKDSGYLPLLGLQVIAKPFKIPFDCSVFQTSGPKRASPRSQARSRESFCYSATRLILSYS